LVNEREQARRLKDYARADIIREKLTERGVVVQDTPEGPVWRKLSTPA
jgi:cysteinyl-tRNA synthetase